MTLADAILKLMSLQKKHGDVEVYFDCPYCLKSFAPNTVQALAVHLTERDHLGRKPPSEGTAP